MTRKLEISKHKLVPQHEILSEEEARMLLDKLNISRGQLPKTYKNDPMVKKIKATVGDIIRITRKSKTAGESYYYRVVIEP
ncbi:DNA-directed RNA polymerase subunit H [archaeon]|nr:DNA-directed RNA polymerase subunit H [archaeon]